MALITVVSWLIGRLGFSTIVLMMLLALWLSSVSNYRWLKIGFFALSLLLISPYVFFSAYIVFMFLLATGIDLS
ncbi:hypothetical protein [Providencia rustigianii]|nr:hypothetical protein [Providencia rustigianii]SPY78500.1 Uncharacterised protein [Providencia rustigianii]SUC28131.1 Uncharacterised protein [Providencia rustigianii]